LNLLNNPLEFPPLTVVNRGIKYVKEYLKANCDREPDDIAKKIPKSVEPNIVSVNDDMWPSDSDDDLIEKKRPLSGLGYNNRTKKNGENSKKKKFDIFFNYFI
jgi:hypothetical protein